MAIAFQRPGDAIGMTIAWMALMNGTVLLLPADLINLLVTMASVSPKGTNAMVTTIVGIGLMNETVLDLDLHLDQQTLLVAQVICGYKMVNLIAALQHTPVEKTKVTVMTMTIAYLVLYAITIVTTAILSTQGFQQTKTLTAV